MKAGLWIPLAKTNGDDTFMPTHQRKDLSCKQTQYCCPTFSAQSFSFCDLCNNCNKKGNTVHWSLFGSWKCKMYNNILIHYDWDELNILLCPLSSLPTERDDGEDLQLNKTAWTTEFTFQQSLSPARNSWKNSNIQNQKKEVLCTKLWLQFSKYNWESLLISNTSSHYHHIPWNIYS